MDIGATIDLATQPLIEQIEAQQKEIEALLGVIDGMKIIIKNLEDERNRQNDNTN